MWKHLWNVKKPSRPIIVFKCKKENRKRKKYIQTTLGMKEEHRFTDMEEIKNHRWMQYKNL